MNERIPSPIHLRRTPLLDYEHPAIADLVESRRWLELPIRERIGAVYAFVRDEIAFGYNASDDLPASRVLEDGYGQCNTKSTLLMALLRRVSVPCRFRGLTVHKKLQKGVLDGLAYLVAPREILHSWVEVFLDGRWLALEGVILDRPYLDGVRVTIADRGPLLGWAVGVDDVATAPIEWKGDDTFVQKTGVVRDFGLFDDPDAFWAAQGTNATGVRAFLFERWIRPRMNANVARLRATASAPRLARDELEARQHERGAQAEGLAERAAQVRGVGEARVDRRARERRPLCDGARRAQNA